MRRGSLAHHNYQKTSLPHTRKVKELRQFSPPFSALLGNFLTDFLITRFYDPVYIYTLLLTLVVVFHSEFLHRADFRAPGLAGACQNFH